jgi:hypothetical protein
VVCFGISDAALVIGWRPCLTLPENPSKKTWSSSDYKHRKAERDTEPKDSGLLSDAETASGFDKALERAERGHQMVSDVSQQVTDGLVKANIEKSRAEQLRRKSDTEEAVDNALKKSEDRASALHDSLPAESQPTEPPNKPNLGSADGGAGTYEQSLQDRHRPYMDAPLPKRETLPKPDLAPSLWSVWVQRGVLAVAGVIATWLFEKFDAPVWLG